MINYYVLRFVIYSCYTNETCCTQSEHGCIFYSLGYIPIEFYQDWSKFVKVTAKIKRA